MATLALAAAGAAVGGWIAPGVIAFGMTGASVGWTVGAIAGNMLFAPRSRQTGPRLQDLQVTSSTYGVALPTVYGTARIAGNIIWADELEERENTEDVGGKGGGGTEVTSFAYYGTFAVALCEGEVSGIRRIWANGKLIYDLGANALPRLIGGTLSLSDNVIVYVGSEAQDPSSVIEAVEGSGNVPGYRGVCYLVFSELALAPYGNAIPNIEAEVIVDGTVTVPALVREYTSFLKTTGDASVASITPTSAVLQGDAILLRQNLNPPTFEARESVINAAADEVLVNGYGWSNVVQGDWELMAGQTCGQVYNLPDWCAYQGGIWDAGLGTYDPTSIVLVYQGGGAAASFGCPLMSASAGIDNQVIAALKFSGETWVYAVSGTALLVRQRLPKTADDIGAITPNSGPYPPADFDFCSSDDIADLTWSANGHKFIAADEDNRWIVVQPNGLSASLIFVVDGETLLIRAVYSSSWNDGTADRSFYPIAAGGGRMVAATQIGSGDNRIGVFDVSAAGGSVASPLPLVALHASLEQLQAGIDGGNHPTPCSGLVILGTELWKYSDSLSDTPPTLEEVVERIAVSAGYGEVDVDAASLAGITVSGFVRKERMSAVSLLSTLSAAYGFDVAEVDGKLLAKLRSATSSATLDEADLIYSDATVKTVRRQETELPQQLDLSYFAKDADFAIGAQSAQRIVTSSRQRVGIDVPVVLSDADAAEMARRILWESWVGRTSRQFTVGPKWAKAVPTDVVTLPVGDATVTCRITAQRRSGIGIECEAIDVDAAAFTQPATAGVVPGIPTSVANAGPTEFHVLEIPPLADSHDGYGFYVAANSYGSVWRGALIFVEPSAGAQPLQMGGAFNGAAFGRAAAALADTDLTDGQIDCADTLEVDITFGTLPASITVTEQLEGNANTFLIGDEIVCARTVTSVAGRRIKLSNMIRGVQGTEWAMDSHVAGERVVLLDTNLANIGYTASWIGNTGATAVAVTLGQTYAQGTRRAVEFDGARIKPFPPSNVRATRKANGDIVIQWNRRARVSNTWQGYADVGLDETSEEYELDIYAQNGTTVARSITDLSATSYTYASANVTTDQGVASPAYITVAVYQISSRIGRGNAATKTLKVASAASYSLLLHMNGTDGSTTFTDAYSHTFTVTNATIATAQSKFGGASGSFGGNAYITTPNASDLDLSQGDWTIDGWFYGSSFPNDRNTILNKDNRAYSTDPHYNIYVTSAGKLVVIVGNGTGVTTSQTITGTTTISASRWYHFRVCRSANTIYVFLNGALEISAALTVTMVNGTGALGIGFQNDGPGYGIGRYWNGYLDEIAIFRGIALSTDAFNPPQKELE